MDMAIGFEPNSVKRHIAGIIFKGNILSLGLIDRPERCGQSNSKCMVTHFFSIFLVFPMKVLDLEEQQGGIISLSEYLQRCCRE